jgi:mannose-1-phosphate guanylyltransferase
MFRPPLAALIDTMSKVAGTPAFEATLAQEYGALEKISIDYAVMEKAQNIVVAKAAFPWDDVGSWTAIANHFPHDPGKNVLVGEAAVHASGGNIVFSKDRVTALVGVQDLIVVQAEGVTLVCHRDHAQDIKKLLEELRKSGRHQELL